MSENPTPDDCRRMSNRLAHAFNDSGKTDSPQEVKDAIEMLVWAGAKIERLEGASMPDTKALVDDLSTAELRLGKMAEEVDNPAVAGVYEDAAILMNRAKATIERLEAKADAFNDMTALLANGYHSFEWSYDSDAETLTLLCYDEKVELAYPDSQENGTEKTLAEMKKKTGS